MRDLIREDIPTYTREGLYSSVLSPSVPSTRQRKGGDREKERRGY